MAWSKTSRVAVDETFFDGIDTGTQAYWLGFIVGDGSLRDKSGLKITLKASDRNHLENFKEDISSEAPVSDATWLEEKNACTISISNGNFCRSLKNLGINPDKVNGDCMPTISKEFYPFFIRGFFDADGGWWDDGTRKRWSITAKSKVRLEQTKEMMNYIGIESNIYSNGNKYWKLEVRKNNDIQKIWKIMYPDGMDTAPMLERKSKKIQNWVNNIVLAN